jgi:hypothetical protein
MDFQKDAVRQYFTESWKIFTAYATIANVYTDEHIPSVLYRELQNIYCIYHTHRWNYSIGDLLLDIQTKLFRRYIYSMNFFLRAFCRMYNHQFLIFFYQQN